MTLILFGATGDLAQKKIIPALFELFGGKLLPEDFTVVCFVRRNWSKAETESFVKSLLPNDDSVNEFASHFVSSGGDIDNASAFLKLKEILDLSPMGERIFHLAIPPAFYKDAIVNIRDAGIFEASSKMLIEKPFGRNSDEAKELNETLSTFLKEEQIFRIDHYLGKDAIVEIKSVSKENISNIEARIIESSTVGSRGAFYDETGAFLDVGQNHLLMMLKIALGSLSNLRVDGNIRRGQYAGYKEEKSVPTNSNTETYFKLSLKSNGVECVTEAGKAFASNISEIIITYNDGKKAEFDFNKSKDGSLTPYAKVIAAAINADHSLFVSKEDLAEEWRIADEALPTLRSASLWVYPKGTAQNNLFK